MTKQQLAQKRNYFKYVLTGMYRHIDLSILTLEEQILWSKINDTRLKLIEQFDKSSREKGLRAPEHKCWCGKEGKYKPEYELYNVELVCKKHIKE